MSQQQPEKVFPAGLIYKLPSAKAPAWGKANLSFKGDEFVAWLKQYDLNGWVNVDVKESKGGKVYCELSMYKREAPKEDGHARHPDEEVDPGSEINAEDIPY